MTEYKNQYPCKTCHHPEEDHFEFDDIAGQWMYNDDVGHEVWVESPYPRLVCNSCGNDCEFVKMTNLDYLEWKANDTDRNTEC